MVNGTKRPAPLAGRFGGWLPMLAMASMLSVYGPAAFSQDFQVRDKAGAALSDAVIYLTPEDTRAPVARPAPASIVQQHKMFMPLVTVVQKGAAVDFPNRDDIAHDVYSLSDAKRFELKLYRGGSKQVVFDKTGVVTIGCNIHDMMIAYVVVVDTPYFMKTDASGRGALPKLPAGRYRIAAWHPRLGNAPAAVIGTFSLPAQTSATSVSSSASSALPVSPASSAPFAITLPLRGD